MKRFNTTAVCIPQKHYMVDISDKLEQMIEMIENEEYFTINRSRQYGKTTTMFLLEQKLNCKYDVITVSFEGAGSEAFQSDEHFVRYFIRIVYKALTFTSQSEAVAEGWKSLADYEDGYVDAFDYLSDKITWLCKKSEKEILLFIDEVDKTSDNQIFLNFLGMLRNKYLERQKGKDVTFKSVILAGVYDIKNLKLKLRPEEERKYNSPWITHVGNEENGCLQTLDDCPWDCKAAPYNIAAYFNVDMSFPPKEISTMLQEYEEDHHTGMDIEEISKTLYFYTNGYPYLVSWLCKWVDEQGDKVWTKETIDLAIKHMLETKTTLFDDLSKKYDSHTELAHMIDDMLFGKRKYPYFLADDTIALGVMFGIFDRKDSELIISNIIFEQYFANKIIIRNMRKDAIEQPERSQFIKEGRLDMPHVLTKFQEIMKAEYRREDGKFLEQQGRLLFLCFLKPIINGSGFYYVEPETRNNTRMDIVVTYGKEEHIIELKLWHGDQYRKDGIKQLEGYLESRNNENGYLVSFSFNQNKEYTSGWLEEEETKKHIFEIVI